MWLLDMSFCLISTFAWPCPILGCPFLCSCTCKPCLCLKNSGWSYFSVKPPLSYLLRGSIQGSHLLSSHISLYRGHHVPLHRLLLALSDLHSNHLHPARDQGRWKDGDLIYFPNIRHSLHVLHTEQIFPNHLLCVRHRDIAVGNYGNTVCPHGACIETTEPESD